MQKISDQIISRIADILSEDDLLAEPILYTLRSKLSNNSLATHGVDCYLMAQFVEISVDNRLDMAAATELAWTCILMYDDIIDNDTTRYGDVAAWKKIGVKQTEKSIEYGFNKGAQLHPYPKTYEAMYQKCINSQIAVKKLSLDSRVIEVEAAYDGYKFGCFDYLLPFEVEVAQKLRVIGLKTMLMAQLINDYKDTCGSRRIARNYPELRERQANYITALYVDSATEDQKENILTLLKTANHADSYEAIAAELSSNADIFRAKNQELMTSVEESIKKLELGSLRTFMSAKAEKLSASYASILEDELAA